MLARLIVGAVCCLIAAACAPTPTAVEVIQTQPLPEFLQDIGANVNPEARPPFAQRTVCVWPNEAFLWRPGDQGLSLVLSAAIMTLVGQPLDNDLSSNNQGPAYLVHDDDGNLIGSWGESMHCYGIDSAAIGIHDMRYELTTSAGEKFAYSWQIEVK